MAKAATNIKHGSEDGSVTWVDAGDDVPGDIDVDELPPGTVEDDQTSEDKERLEELQAQVAELEAKLSSQQAQDVASNVPLLEGAPAETNEFGDEAGAGTEESSGEASGPTDGGPDDT